MLKRRYDKKRIIIQRHIRALFELQSVSKENFTNLRHLVDGVLKHLRALKAIGRPTDSWDDVIIHLITSKLDHVTNKEWEDNISDEDIPTIQHLTDFLEHRCHTLEAVSRKAQSASVSQTKANQARVSSLASSGVASCQNCRGDHQIYSCERFLKLSPEDRLKVVKENKLCWNCMKFSRHTGIPEPTLTEIQECRLTKLQRTEQMRQYLWNRWSKDYLNQLQQRTKWKTKGIDLKPGDMVLIREDNIPPLCWPMGRVMETHPGDDGAVRVVTLKTMRGLFKRPVNRLSLLPMEP
ncbi:hypothetical protein ALC57_03264 [Trachymyrmex cornetzi]|uniref:DUF5641 domain-containing protein n=1 Tax=Trachymyrmex cornetzi TaxID=471704 RepID=A0A151JMF2_9HYME|nr:hypothetical protein ALC57_03264 [Trachymyrmex cornetzi]